MQRGMDRTMHVLIGIGCLLAILGLPPLTWGLTLDEAKSQGLVGERPNGYLGVVSPRASAEAQALVNEVNQKRRMAYADIARSNSANLATVETLAGDTAIKNTKPGNFIQLPSGEWTKK